MLVCNIEILCFTSVAIKCESVLTKRKSLGFPFFPALFFDPIKKIEDFNITYNFR